MAKTHVHFLHIGKTGGSAIKAALRAHTETPNYTLELHSHKTALSDVPAGDRVIFFLRDPISRFVSGFYSRQRKGAPRHFTEWTDLEKRVFSAFGTPNELARALAERQALALDAMHTIKHLVTYRKWYGDMDYFLARRADILFIGFQETLDADFLTLTGLLGVTDAALPADDIGAHRNPAGLDRRIDEVGLAALNE